MATAPATQAFWILEALDAIRSQGMSCPWKGTNSAVSLHLEGGGAVEVVVGIPEASSVLVLKILLSSTATGMAPSGTSTSLVSELYVPPGMQIREAPFPTSAMKASRKEVETLSK
jgi:hypothetical protein